METPRLPLSLTPPSPELETLVELLVDDELDAVERRALLERLDAVDGGWKYCATAFLEAQTFRKAFRAFAAASERVDLAAFGDFNPSADFNASAPSPDVEVDALLNQLDVPGNIGAAVSPASAPFAASRRDFPEPRIIPLNASASRGGFRRSFGSGGSDGDGPRRFPRFVATTAGLLLSVAFGALLYRQLAPTSSPRVPSSRLDAVASVETPPSPAVPPVAPRGVSAPPASSFANAVGTAASASPIRYVTLRSPSRSLDDVAVPCVEGDLDDLAALRATRADSPDVPPQIAEALRTSGGRLQTVRDEFRFPLEDGRTLVLPVDVYEIRAEIIPIN
ncbi:MAG: hypothetical protein IKK39_01605 [Thermoguttaceae bacterium]|nr:hypothetical protein [Thermoguttaceae bacterium]MBR4102740.1 hypothetical protein [Thermoguttaceae bacterium]